MYHNSITALKAAGFNHEDAVRLRRDSMMLHRWHELECGDGNGCIERDEATGKAYWLNSHTMKRHIIADRETPALKRIANIVAKYPGFDHYIQGDPRGAALYIMTPGQMASREPGWLEANYSQGIAVHK